jgi:hypothetical protein
VKVGGVRVGSLSVSLVLGFRVSGSVVTRPNIPGRCPHAILRKRYRCTSVLTRAVRTRLVPRVEDILKRRVKKATSRGIPTFSSLGNEEKVCGGPEGQAGRVGMSPVCPPPAVPLASVVKTGIPACASLVLSITSCEVSVTPLKKPFSSLAPSR